VAQLKAKELVRKSKSPWASLIIVVPKKGKKLQICVDYRKVKINEKDREKTVFAVPFGTYKMPFGLCNASTTFQYIMNYMLADFIEQFVVVYLDDIVIYSASFNEHLHHIAAVFEKLKAVGLKLNYDKCAFFQLYLHFLGHIIRREGVRPNNSKVEKVQNFPAPVNLRQLCRFIGLASYYRKFIPNFASIARPLHHLLRKDVEYEWTHEQE
ncbi:23032_t:CDS:2, partial [Dentiscutata erythropus]